MEILNGIREDIFTKNNTNTNIIITEPFKEGDSEIILISLTLLSRRLSFGVKNYAAKKIFFFFLPYFRDIQ